MFTKQTLLAIIVAVVASLMVFQAIQSEARPNRNGGGGGRFDRDVPDDKLPNHAALTAALIDVVQEDNAGFGLDMWATLVNRDGIVTAITFSGADRGEQWPGSCVISAQKANTVNAFSLPGLALATSNLYTAVQPGGSLFGLQESNPVDTSVAYQGPPRRFGQEDDPMTGNAIGGVNVFGGGLACYNSEGELVGAIGVSGDTSCTDHIIAWKVRHALELDYVPGGVGAEGSDNAVYDIGDGDSGWGHPGCGGDQAEITANLLTTHSLRSLDAGE